MAENKRISELTAASALDGTELMHVVQGGNSRQTTAVDVANLSGFNRDDVTALLADTTLTYTAGQAGTVAAGDYVRTRAEGFSYEVAASGATDEHLTTAGGVKLYVTLAGGEVHLAAFGGKDDGATDNSDAITKAINAFPDVAGFDIIVGAGVTKIDNAALYFTRPIRIRGQSRQEGVSVLDFSDCTTIVNAPYKSHIIAVHSNNISGSSSYGDPIVLPAGQVGTYGLQSGLIDLNVRCNPAVTDGIGVFANVAMNCERVRVYDANLHNWCVAGVADNLQTRGGAAGPSGLGIGGNSNNGVYTDVWARGAVNGDGIHCAGADANHNIFTHPDCAANKGWGVNDDVLHGNVYAGLHTSSNLYGAARSRTASANRSMWLSPYAEGGQGTDNSNTFYEMSARALIVGASGVTPNGEFPALVAENDGIVSKATFSVMDAADTEDTGGTFGRIGRGEVSLRTSDGGLFEVKRSGSAYTAIKYRGTNYILFHNSANGVIGLGVPFFPSGFALSTSHRQTTGSAAPVSGSWTRGEVVWNNSPSAGGYMGWTCVTSGTPGVWKGFGLIEA